MAELSDAINQAKQSLEANAKQVADQIIPELTPKPGSKSPVWTSYSQARNRMIAYLTDRLDFERALHEALESAQGSIVTLTDDVKKMKAVEQANTELADSVGRAEAENARLRDFISKMAQERDSLDVLYAACDLVIADFMASTGLRPSFSGRAELDAEGKHLVRKLRFGHYDVMVIPHRGVFTISAPGMAQQTMAISDGITPDGNLALFGFLHFEALNAQKREALPLRLKQAYYTDYAETSAPTQQATPQPSPVSDDERNEPEEG